MRFQPPHWAFRFQGQKIADHKRLQAILGSRWANVPRHALPAALSRADGQPDKQQHQPE